MQREPLEEPGEPPDEVPWKRPRAEPAASTEAVAAAAASVAVDIHDPDSDVDLVNELRNTGTVTDWCLKHGATLRHEEAFSEKVARMITLGSSNHFPLPQDILKAVPQATAGSWWITFTAENGLHLMTHQRLASYAENFRENVWRPERQQRWSKYTLELVEEEVEICRMALFMERLVREDGLDETAHEEQAQSTASHAL